MPAGYEAGYERASGDSPGDAPYLINGSTDIASLTAEILIGALGATLTFAFSGGATALSIVSTEVVVNEGASSTMDFRVEGATEANLLFVDASTEIVHVRGQLRIGSGSAHASFDTETETNVLIQDSATGDDGIGATAVNSSTATKSYANFRCSADNNTVLMQMYADGLGTGPVSNPNAVPAAGGYIGTFSNHSWGLFTNDVERGRMMADGQFRLGGDNTVSTSYDVATEALLLLNKSETSSDGLSCVIFNEATATNSYAAFKALGNNATVLIQMYADGLGGGPLGVAGGYVGCFSNHPVGMFSNNIEVARFDDVGPVVSIFVNDATTDAATDILLLRHTSTGTPTTNFGFDIVCQLEDAGNNTVEAGTIRCFFQDATANTSDSAFSFFVMRNDTLFEVARFTGGSVASNEALMLGQNGGTVTIASLDDVDTGIQWLGSNQLSFLSGGSASIAINTSGQVNHNTWTRMIAARFSHAKGTDVASATDIVLGAANFFDITGTATITTISATNWNAGSIVVLQFDSGATVAHNTAGTGASILLGGASNFVASTDDTLTLIYDGVTWRELARTAI